MCTGENRSQRILIRIGGPLAYNERLAERIRLALGRQSDVTERKMFGGIAFLHDGRMCCGIVGQDLMVRILEVDMPSVMRQLHVRPMDFTGRPLRGFVYVAPAALSTARALKTWIDRGLRFASSAEAPRRARTSSAKKNLRDCVARYEKLVATNPRIERKGATMPYTSLNGHMFSFLTKTGTLALRLPAAEREAFLKKYETHLCEQRGTVRAEYVEVPDVLLRKTRELKPFFDLSWRYVAGLKPRSSGKAKKR